MPRKAKRQVKIKVDADDDLEILLYLQQKLLKASEVIFDELESGSSKMRRSAMTRLGTVARELREVTSARLKYLTAQETMPVHEINATVSTMFLESDVKKLKARMAKNRRAAVKGASADKSTGTDGVS